MDNNNFNNNDVSSNQNDQVKQQQFIPGLFPPPDPGVIGPPTIAPPDFIPDLPRVDVLVGGAPVDFRTQYGDVEWRRRGRRFRRCLHRFTYLLLYNGNHFWFYPTFVGWQTVEGYRFTRGRWVYDRINLNFIFFFRCF